MKRMLAMALCLAVLTGACPALAIGYNEAEAAVRAADAQAAQAKRFWVYQDGDAAWVFYAVKEKGGLFEGAFWYVDDDGATRLGEYTKNVYSWNFLRSDPPLFTSITRYQNTNHLHAALRSDAAPVQITNMGDLTALYEDGGNLCGVWGKHSDDYIFLAVQANSFVQVAAAPIEEADARRFSGVGAVLDALKNGDGWYQPGEVQVTGLLYRPAVPGQSGDVPGSIAVNVTYKGKPHHAYIFIDASGEAHAQRGWEEEIILHEGEAKTRYDIAFDVAE